MVTFLECENRILIHPMTDEEQSTEGPPWSREERKPSCPGYGKSTSEVDGNQSQYKKFQE
jgi:hypothetical protein